jgi:hypothetical protein
MADNQDKNPVLDAKVEAPTPAEAAPTPVEAVPTPAEEVSTPAEEVSTPVEAVPTPVKEVTQGPVMQEMPKAPKKLLLVVGIIVVVLALIFGLIYWGGNSNTKIPVFSSVAASLEKGIGNNSRMARKDSVEDMFEPFLKEADEFVGEEMTMADLQEILLNGVEEAEPMESFKTKGSFDIQASEELTGEGEYDVSFDFDIYVYENLDESRPEMELDMQLELAAEMMGESFEGKADLRLIEEILYAKVSDVTPDLGPDFEPMVDMWFSLDGSEYFDLMEETAEAAEEEDLADQVMFEEVSEEDLEMIRAMLYSDAIVNSIVVLDDREYDGIQTKCTQYDFDQEDLAILVDVAAEYSDEEVSDTDIEEAKELFDEMYGDFSLVLEECIGRGDNMPYFMSVVAEADGLMLSIDMEYYDYGVMEDIEIPSGAESLDELVEQMVPTLDDELTYEDTLDFDYDTSLDELDTDYDSSYEEYDWDSYFEEDFDW